VNVQANTYTVPAVYQVANVGTSNQCGCRHSDPGRPPASPKSYAARRTCGGAAFVSCRPPHRRRPRGGICQLRAPAAPGGGTPRLS
jgi:hypothetical protein